MPPQNRGDPYAGTRRSGAVPRTVYLPRAVPRVCGTQYGRECQAPQGSNLILTVGWSLPGPTRDGLKSRRQISVSLGKPRKAAPRSGIDRAMHSGQRLNWPYGPESNGCHREGRIRLLGVVSGAEGLPVSRPNARRSDREHKRSCRALSGNAAGRRARRTPQP
jgi:hypothetical protein